MQPIPLTDLDFDGLCKKWQVLFRRKPPLHLPEYLMRRVVIYRLQANAHGELDKDSIVFLDKVADARTKRLADASAKSRKAPPPVPAVLIASQLKPGSILVREYAGQNHKVTVDGPGRFLWNEQTYGSLSEVAYAITGTNWNGPRFFGLRSTSLRPSAAEGARREA
jgi:hypothetical protein